MAVRFLPPPEERPKPPREETGDLAEVIEFRSKLRRPEPQNAPAQPPASETDPETTAAWAPAPVAVDSEGDVSGDDDAPEPEGAPPASWPRLVAAPFERPDGLNAPDVPEETLDEGPTAYETAVKLLARRAQSSGELQRALVAAGHPDLDAEAAVSKCQESLYLDDADLACSVAAKLRDSKGESKARIRQKLRERYLPDAAIEAALEGLDDEAEFELLKQTAIDRARRMAGLDRQTAERRLLGFLARRGWSGERASRAAREALDGAGPSGSGRGTVRFR